jgi:lambda repressor-like predicted transcriptional regulator
MSKATRKNWTRTMALARLRDIDSAFEDVQKLADGGGKMPAALRNKLKTARAKIEDVIAAFVEWTP